MNNNENTSTNEVIRVLKKRGRKKKIIATHDNIKDESLNDPCHEIEETEQQKDIQVKVHKKRGRKPKNFKTIEDQSYRPSDVVEFEYKKKGRKNKYIVNDKTTIKDKIVFNNNVDDENENIVLHLPIHLHKINENELHNMNSISNNSIHDTNIHSNNYNNINETPKPYDPIINNISSSTPYLLDSNISENIYFELDKKNKKEIMVQFSECNKRNEWLSSTSIHCFWCSHPFSGIPCSLPQRKINDTYYVFGNFCSPECAASYNFNNYDDRSIEKYSLLNGLYRKVYNNKDYIVQLAPPQMSLRIFGGTLTIEQFRSYNKNNNKILMINIPPLVSIIPEIEETTSEINMNNKNSSYIPLDGDRIKNYNEKLKLQRNKPISDKKNTLETCMNLKYV